MASLPAIRSAADQASRLTRRAVYLDRYTPAAGRYPTQAGPSSCFRSASSDGDGLTRSLSSSRTTVVRAPLSSRRCTSVAPGWVRSTSRSRSTTGGTHRASMIDTTKGPWPSAGSSGTLTSIATSLGTSSRRSSRPFTSTIASSMISDMHAW